MKKARKNRVRGQRRPSQKRKRKGSNERVQVNTEKSAKPMIGELSLHRDGYGFVVCTEAGGDDLFIPAKYIGDALHTDLVEAIPVSGRAGKMEGRIRKIVERRVKSLMGRLEKHENTYQVIADDRRVKHRIQIPSNKLSGAKHGDNVVVEIVSYPQGEKLMAGFVQIVLGKRGDVDTEKAAVVYRYQLVREFPDEVEAEARKVREDFLSMDGTYEGRTDLRKIPFVTVDGETAKDFDDAIAVRTEEDGTITLWVAIADVSNFVKVGSALDDEAFERGTSVYFPGDCIPMLPEALSNDSCSLMPGEDRLTVTAEMKIDKYGNVIDSRFYKSVIKSVERMTYTAIKRILVEKNSSVRGKYSSLLSEFELMEECYKRLRKNRLDRGTIDFDLPEPEIVIDMKGDISDIVRADRHVGHMIIEEFMVAANEAVARFLTENDMDCIYRVHETPPEDKLKEFAILMHNLGYKFRIKKHVKSADLAKISAAVKGKPEERMVNHMLLRSMSQAVYSDENQGHFGLASGCYCHFTSPIRRYPDLVVHRLLTNAISRSHDLTISQVAEHCSRRDRVAMQAEREMAKLYSALFMKDRISEEFDGIISHITKFGFFVELIDYFVEGLVHISTMDDDKYTFNEEGYKIVGKKSGKLFAIGDRVRIEVDGVDVANREIMFLLV